MTGGRTPGPGPIRFRLLERNRLHHRIKEADASGDVAQVVELQRHLGELNDAIASGSSI